MTSVHRTAVAAVAGVAIAALALAPGAVPGATAEPATVPIWLSSVVDEDPTHGSGEPSITVADDGTIYIVAPAGLTGQRSLPPPFGGGGDLLWRSDDKGETWTYLPTGVVGGGDADVVAGPGDELFASGLSLACVSVARSPDRGVSWVTNPISCSDAPVDDRQWNDLHDGSVYTSFGSIVADEIYVNRSLVSSPAVIAGPNVRITGTDHQWVGVLDVDPTEGTVYASWNTQGAPNDCDDGGCEPADASTDTPDRVMVVALGDSDFGAPPVTVAEPVVVAERAFDTFDAFVGVDVDPDGVVYVVWNERHPEVRETWSMLAVSSDHGATWSPPVRVNEVATTAFPWVTAGDDGRVMVSYYGTSARGNSPETVDGQWRVFSSYSDDGGASFEETVVTPSPMHAGAVCTSGTGCATGARDLLDFFESDVDPQGCVVLTYTDNSRDVVVAGERVTDNPELIAFARQVGGPSLREGGSCGSAVVAAPTASSGPSTGPSTAPSTAPTAAPRPLPSTGGGSTVALAALVLTAGALALAPSARRRRAKARR